MPTPHTKKFNMIFDNKNVIMCMIYDRYIGFLLQALD